VLRRVLVEEEQRKQQKQQTAEVKG
jgi:hypothetical protein